MRFPWVVLGALMFTIGTILTSMCASTKGPIPLEITLGFLGMGGLFYCLGINFAIMMVERKR